MEPPWISSCSLIVAFLTKLVNWNLLGKLDASFFGIRVEVFYSAQFDLAVVQ
jgi:hypothetical protein